MLYLFAFEGFSALCICYMLFLRLWVFYGSPGWVKRKCT